MRESASASVATSVADPAANSVANSVANVGAFVGLRCEHDANGYMARGEGRSRYYDAAAPAVEFSAIIDLGQIPPDAAREDGVAVRIRCMGCARVGCERRDG